MAPLTSVAGQTVATKSQAKSMPIPPFLYAEFLPKLGRISIVIHLPTPSTYLTKALVSDDARRLLVYHEGATTELVLPVKTALKNEHLPGEIPPGLDEMSWRLVPHKSEVAAAGFGRSGFDAGAVPWSAVDLKPHVDVTCRTCGTVFISKDNLKEWKDLPSENWAEMMEFWHCHKPTNNTKNGQENGKQTTEDQQTSRGYGANSAIGSQKGVGFVDLTKMLFHGDDFQELMISSGEQSGTDLPPSPGTPGAACICCSTQVGHFEFRKNGISLFKWMINIVDDAEDDAEADAAAKTQSTNGPTLSHCLAAALVATQARSGSAKVVLQGVQDALTIWVLNAHIKFSCMEKGKQKVPAMKLLFRNNAMDEDEIPLPDVAVKQVRGILEESNKYLPRDERTKMVDGQLWTVALLERVEH